MKNKKIILILTFTIFAGLLVLFSVYYLPFIADDALISMRYAQRFIDGKGLTWTEGCPVEGYSNLLWVLGMSLLGVLGIDLIDAVRILGYFSHLLVIFLLIFSEYRRHKLRKNLLPISAGLFFFAMSSTIAVWTVGGLEQPFIALFLTSALLSFFRYLEDSRTIDLVLSSLSLGLLCLNRPDGPLFSVAIGSGLIIIRQFMDRKGWLRELGLLALFPVLMYGGQIIWRHSYYGELVPNTALVKIAFTQKRIFEGLLYAVEGYFAILPLALLGAFLLGLMLKSSDFRRKGIVLLLVQIVMTTYLIFIGGDFFPAFRHFIAIVVVLVMIVIDGLKILLPMLRVSRLRLAVFAMLIAFGYLSLQIGHYRNRSAYNERWEWTGMELGSILGLAFSDAAPVVAVTAAGSIPYSYGLPSLDMLGLNDYWLPRHPPDDFGTGNLGHELGNADYVIRCSPDILVFFVGEPFSYRVGKDLEKSREYSDRLRPIRVHLDSDPSVGLVYFDKYSPKIGIRKTPDGYIVPGYLMGNAEHGFLYLEGDSVLVSRLDPGDPPLSIEFDIDLYGNLSMGMDSLCVEVIPDGNTAAISREGTEIRLEVMPSPDRKTYIRSIRIQSCS